MPQWAGNLKATGCRISYSIGSWEAIVEVEGGEKYNQNIGQEIYLKKKSNLKIDFLQSLDKTWNVSRL